MGEEDRYLFGRIDQKTLAMTIRINLSLAPNLSIQFYGQPFVSAGDYSELKRITSPHHANYKQRFEVFSTNQFTLDPIEETYRIDENVDGLMDYSFDNPDFNFLQVRSNLVVRWEYKPGSTVYLVWSQGRTDDSSIGRFSYFRDLENLFNTHPHNVFLIKFSYSFNR